jgi:amino acid permease
MQQPKNIARLQKIYSIIFLLLPLFAMAGEEFDDDTNDVEPPLPIDDYILLAILIGIYIAYRFLKTYDFIKTKN